MAAERHRALHSCMGESLSRNGLAILNEETRDGGPVDPQVKSKAKAWIELGLKALDTKNGKVQGNVEISKTADLLISKILSDQKNQFMPGNIPDKADTTTSDDIVPKNNETSNTSSGIDNNANAGSGKDKGNSADQ